MCGIAGIVALGPQARPPTREEAAGMAERLRHRGPDARTAWASPSGRCALGHARLEVIDLVTGDQPMSDESGRVQVVFNGEIYNFREVRDRLEREGHVFRTASDTEVIVHGYKAWGDALPEYLDGMFALAVWDEERGRLFLARDRVGKKPLYWTHSAGRFAFASEIKALLALEDVSDDLDPRAFPFYLAYGYVPGPGTFYRDVRVLPPAHRLAVDAERGDLDVRPDRYWRLTWEDGPDGPDEHFEGEVRSLLGRAVDRRLVADVPLGAFLSGGIDSTLIVGLMRERIEGTIRTFSLGFADDPTYDETRWARMAADRFGTEHTEFVVEAHNVSLVDELVEAYDQPFGDSSAIPTHIVSRLTREHVTVALTGDGGDEMFAGYPRFLGMVVAEAMPDWAVRVGDSIGRRLPHHADFRHPTRRFSRFFGAAALPPEERMLRWIGFLPDRAAAMLKPELRSLVDHRELIEHFKEPWERHAQAGPLAATLALNFETYLPEDLLVKADRCSMSHGLELRSPFLDTDLMEFAAQLPDRVRIRRRTLKWLLRSAFPDILPPEILSRGKWGFGVPLPLWFRTHWKGFFEDRMFGPGAESWQWLEREPVERLWREHLSGTVDHGHALWALLTLETWLRRRSRGR